MPDWSEDVAIVATAIKTETDMGNEVFVVAHSYGAAVTCQAMEGIPVTVPSFGGDVQKGGVVKLGFITGMIQPIGQCFFPIQANETSRIGGGITMKVGMSDDGSMTRAERVETERFSHHPRLDSPTLRRPTSRRSQRASQGHDADESFVRTRPIP